MYIKGSSTIKGVLEIPSIRQQLKRNSILPIRDTDFWNSDVQTALRMGYIEAVGEPQYDEEGNIEEPEERAVLCKNMTPRTIDLPGVDEQVLPDKEFTMKETCLRNADIKAAISRGLIKVLEVLETDDEIQEAFLEIGEEWDEEIEDMKNELAEDTENFKKELRGGDSEETPQLTPAQQMLAQAIENQNKKKNLDTNTELKTAKKTVEEDPKKKSVVWNPSKSVIDSDNPGPVDATSETPDSKATVTNPNKQEVTSDMEVNQDVDDILFADQEEQEDKRKAHPVLKNAEKPKESAPIMLDMDEEEEKRAASHPVLGKKTNEEVDVLE